MHNGKKVEKRKGKAGSSGPLKLPDHFTLKWGEAATNQFRFHPRKIKSAPKREKEKNEKRQAPGKHLAPWVNEE